MKIRRRLQELRDRGIRFVKVAVSRSLLSCIEPSVLYGRSRLKVAQLQLDATTVSDAPWGEGTATWRRGVPWADPLHTPGKDWRAWHTKISPPERSLTGEHYSGPGPAVIMGAGGPRGRTRPLRDLEKFLSEM